MPNLETVNPGWSRYEHYTFSPAARKGNLLFISGLTATDEAGNLVGEGA
jgi:enamine deaminase RidA (YjgF/YER057c/UK114 family)